MMALDIEILYFFFKFELTKQIIVL